MIDNDQDNMLIVPYVDLTDRPAKKLHDAITFIAPGHAVDQKLLDGAIETLGVSRTRHVWGFKYFDSKECEAAEVSVAQELRLLGLNSILNRETDPQPARRSGSSK